MKWYEYIIIIIAISLVLLPFILSYYNKKKGKVSCGCECKNCNKECPLHNNNDRENKNR